MTKAQTKSRKGRVKGDIDRINRCARTMVRLQARACVITKLTGLPSPRVRDMWQEINGHSSPSGQQPNDLLWYLKTPTRRYHSALLVQLYVKSLASLPVYEALTHAYYHYARLTSTKLKPEVWMFGEQPDPAFRKSERDYEISFARAHYLCQIYNDEVMADGKTRKCSLRIKRCTCCTGLFMGHVDEAARYCPLCINEKK